MIKWKELDGEQKIIDLLWLAPNGKIVPLETSLMNYANDPKQPKAGARSYARKILTLLDGKRPINAIKVKDVQSIFKRLEISKEQTAAFVCRAMIVDAIKYSYTGEVKGPRNRISDGEENAVGKLKFSVAKLDAVRHLVPLSNYSGRFGWIKAEVQRQIYTIQDGEVGVIESPKRSMAVKEANALIGAINTMSKKGRLPWEIRWNQMESVFIVIRQSDLEKIWPKKPLKETK